MSGQTLRKIVGYTPPRHRFGTWVVLACLTVFLVVLIRCFVFQSFSIFSTSMTPTFEIGDHLLINRFSYGFLVPWSKRRILALETPKRGDVIIFSRGIDGDQLGANYLIKRVAAIPGDTVEVRDLQTFVNGKSVDQGSNLASLEKVLKRDFATAKDREPQKLKHDEYFVLGDNRLNSEDSRFFGTVRIGDILGRASVVYFSWKDTGQRHKIRWDRIGRVVR